MALTDIQLEKAKAAYILTQLSERDVKFKAEIDAARAAMDAAEDHFAILQSMCPHPLIMRDHKNGSSTGNWDRSTDSYWTDHKCTMCDKRWQTGQRWAYVGDKHGHPNDIAAKEDK